MHPTSSAPKILLIILCKSIDPDNEPVCGVWPPVVRTPLGLLFVVVCIYSAMCVITDSKLGTKVNKFSLLQNMPFLTLISFAYSLHSLAMTRHLLKEIKVTEFGKAQVRINVSILWSSIFLRIEHALLHNKSEIGI